MRIIKMFTKQRPKGAMRARLGSMDSVVTNETTISHKEKIHVRTGQSRDSVKGSAINSYKDGLRKVGLMEELNEVHVVESRHDELSYSSSPFISTLYTPSTSPLSIQSTKGKTNGEKRTYMGCVKTMGDILECPGIDANSTRTS
jgi:hypothetical protein